MYLEYEEKKTEIKSFLADFMVDDYDPGQQIKRAINDS